LTVTGGQDVTITLKNTGAIEHEWVILRPGTSHQQRSRVRPVAGLYEVPIVAAGESASGSFNLATNE